METSAPPSSSSLLDGDGARRWIPDVRRQHLDLTTGVTSHGGYVDGVATIHCRPPSAPHVEDARTITLHAHELCVRRVVIDGAPGRVIRRGRTIVELDGSETPATAPAAGAASASSAGASILAAAADAARRDARDADAGDGDELVIARMDGGVIARGGGGGGGGGADADAPDVVVVVWYAAGPAVGRPGGPRGVIPSARGDLASPPTPVVPPGASNPATVDDEKAEAVDDDDDGWPPPGAGGVASYVDPDEDGLRYVVTPGPALRPAAWFPCVDDPSRLVHFSVAVACDDDVVAVAPGVLTKRERIERRGYHFPSDEEEADEEANGVTKLRRFVFASGGVPVQAHQMTIAVGTFARKKVPASAAHVASAGFAFAAVAAAEEEVEKEEEIKKRGISAAQDQDDDEKENDAGKATAHSNTHSLLAPPAFDAELRSAASATTAVLASFEEYLGRPFPYPGGLAFAFVPPECMPNAGVAFVGAGVTIMTTDALGHPLSATDLAASRTALAECAARQLFGGFLEPREDTDAWLAEALAAHLAGKCYVSTLMGADEMRYRRAKELEAILRADDGCAMPPISSKEARVWRGGRHAGGASAAEMRARKEAGLRAERAKTGGGKAAEGEEDVLSAVERDAPPASKAARPLPPDVDRLVRSKAIAVIGMLERRLGDEGLRKVMRKLASLQCKAIGAEALQETAAAAAKAAKAAREKATAAAAAARATESTDEAATAALAEKATAAAKEQLQKDHEEAAAYHALAESPARFLRQSVFLTSCRQNATMTKQEMAAFTARWIEGCGCPRLTVGYTFRKSRRQELLFAIKLDGCRAAAAADKIAFRKNPKISVTVRVQETDLPPSDHAVSLSAHDRAYCLMPLQLVTKPKDRRTIARQQQAALDRQARARETGNQNPDDLDAAAAAEVLQWECPVNWVRIDPEGEWLAEVRVPIEQIGLEGMITAQLRKERPADVGAQLHAIAYLRARAEAGSTSAVNALLHCVEDAKTFCRVRADAAKALGACACDDTQRSNLAMTSVMRTYRKRRCDPETGLTAPTDLRNYADALVDEGLVAALGLPRVPAREAAANDMVDYTTPSECVDLLVDMLNNLESDGDPHDMSSLVATALRALGAASLEKTDALQSSLDAISRWLTKDVNICGVGGRTHAGGRRVTTAALEALRAVATRLPSLARVVAVERDARADARAASKKTLRDAASLRRGVSAALARCQEAIDAASKDACQAVRRAGAALAFDVEMKHGGVAGAARALANSVLRCKVEHGAAAKATLLWDARARMVDIETAAKVFALLEAEGPAAASRVEAATANAPAPMDADGDVDVAAAPTTPPGVSGEDEVIADGYHLLRW